MFNKAGSVLPVTVVAMMIMTIVGLVCLQMYMSQNILGSFDQAKKRTLYSAEGVTEALRGYIEKTTTDHLTWMVGDTYGSGNGYLYTQVSAAAGGQWAPISYVDYDSTMYPTVEASVYCEIVVSTALTAENNGTLMHGGPQPVAFSVPTNVYYKIVGIASTTVNSQLIVSTVTYYFRTVRSGAGTWFSPMSYIKHFRGWRKS